MMVVNGATIRFRSKCRIELVSQARFLFGKQIMAPHEAETAMRKLYYCIQRAYVGPVEEREAAAADSQRLLAELRQESAPCAAALDLVEESFRVDDHYRALKLLRTMICEENAARPDELCLP